jgi:hypothetical protein
MKIDGIIWLRDIADKLEFKHNVTMEEVEETLNNRPKFRFFEKVKERVKMSIWHWVELIQEDIYLSSLFTRGQKRHSF